MGGDWSLAKVDHARAWWFDFYLLLDVFGIAPNQCYEVDLVQSPLDVEPPTFIARWHRLPGSCPQARTRYHYRETFKIGARRETICVEHDGEKLTVPVEDYAPDSEPGQLLADAPDENELLISNAYDPQSRELLPFHEAVGYSAAWSLQEAMHSAIKALPRRGKDVPDWLSRYEIVKIGAEIGGLAGWNRLFVRVRG